MNMQNYGSMQGKKTRRTRRKIVGGIIILVILLAGLYILGVLTSNGPEYQMRTSMLEENHTLKEQVAELEEKIEGLEKEIESLKAYSDTDDEPDKSDNPSTPRDEER
ncbi:MAG: hypothetical protein PUF08_02285 [Clostridiales bacterium]|nr:hypothetical protein [Clostridiales bacterium]